MLTSDTGKIVKTRALRAAHRPRARAQLFYCLQPLCFISPGWAEAGGGGGSAIRVGVKVWGEGAVTGVWAIPMVLLDETSK